MIHTLRIAARVALLCLLCTVRVTTFLVEQPSSSLLEYLPYFEHVYNVLKSFMPVQRRFLLEPKTMSEQVYLHRPALRLQLSYMGRWGHFSMKGSIAIGTASGAHHLDYLLIIYLDIVAAEVLDSWPGQAVVEAAQVEIQALLGWRRQKDEGG